MTDPKDPKHDSTSRKIMGSLDNDVPVKAAHEESRTTNGTCSSDLLGDFDSENPEEQLLNLAEMQQKIISLEKEVADAEERAKKYAEENLRTLADMQNSQRRAQQDIANAHKFAIDRFAQELIPVIDSLEQALDATTDESVIAKGVREGIDLTLKLFINTLEKFHLKRIDPQGEIFNPSFHEAMAMQPSNAVVAGTILKVFQKGYTLHDRLIRPARVVVAKAEG